jgi:hypothetical protein
VGWFQGCATACKLVLTWLLAMVVVCSASVAAVDPASSGLAWMVSQQAADGSFGGATAEPKVVVIGEALETNNGVKPASSRGVSRTRYGSMV